jgi:hypothetical protein
MNIYMQPSRVLVKIGPTDCKEEQIDRLLVGLDCLLPGTLDVITDEGVALEQTGGALLDVSFDHLVVIKHRWPPEQEGHPPALFCQDPVRGPL